MSESLQPIEEDTACSRHQDVHASPASNSLLLPEDSGSPTHSRQSYAFEDMALFSLPEAFEPTYSADTYDELEVDGVDFIPNFKGLRDDVVARARQEVTPNRVKLRDKLTFMLGTTGSLLNAYWLGWSPSTFYRVYSIEAVVLVGLRIVIYRLKRWHYYLLDFCYFSNLLLLLQLWLLPKNALMHKVMFAYATGPLAWSIVAFRNSLVFHSLDKITSLMLHWMPACVVWTLRWYPDRSVRLEFHGKSDAAKAEWADGSFLDLVVIPLLPYLLWAICYYIKVFVVSNAKIKERGYETLYQFATANDRSLFGRVVLHAPKRLQPIAYMAMHMVLVTLTFLLSIVFWLSFKAHTAFLIFILSYSAFNGASFYFEVFAHRYIDDVGLQRRERRASKQE